MFVERWTIDEIGDGVVRVLAARSLNPDALGLLAERSRAMAAPARADDAGRQLMAVELGAAAAPEPRAGRAAAAEAGGSAPAVEQSWTEEQDSVLDAQALAEFVARFREQLPEVPQRPLRETDVFWVVAPDAPARALSDGPVRRSDADFVLTAYVTAGPVVRDMTSPARQAIKVLYHDAFRKSEEQS